MTEIAHNRNNTSFYIKRILGIILLLALAVVFSYSAFSKIGGRDGADPFTWTFIDMGFSSMLWAGVIARVFIGLEFMIAALLLAHIFLKSFTYPATITLLVMLTIYLVVQIALHGNTGNCGCFGEELEMTPLNAIWKNLAMIAATIALFYLYPIKPYRHQEWIGAIIGMAAIVTPFVLDPVSVGTTPTVVNKVIDLNPLYEKAPMPHIDLRVGKHIVAFMSLTCPHCRKAAKKLAVLHDQQPKLPIYMVLSGKRAKEKEFFDETKSQAVPHLLFDNMEAFIKMAGPGVPAIYYINNSIIERDANYFQLDPQYMNGWLRQ